MAVRIPALTDEMKATNCASTSLRLAYTLVEAMRRLALKGTEWAEARVNVNTG